MSDTYVFNTTTERNRFTASSQADLLAIRNAAIAAREGAETAQGLSEGARDDALDAKVAAEVARGLSEGARDDAILARAASQAAQEAAEEAESKAREWAVNPEDSPVEPGEYSAYHWAQKAMQQSGGTTDTVTNVSTVPGTNVSEALEWLDGEIYVKRTPLGTVDLNDVRIGGVYGQPAHANATTARNYPFEGVPGALEVLTLDYDTTPYPIVTQRYTTNEGTQRVAVRRGGAAGGWSAWREIALADAIGSAFGRSLINDADAAAARSTLDLGELATGTKASHRTPNPAATDATPYLWAGADVAAAVAAHVPPSLGVGQTWLDVGSSRAENTSYQNTTGRPIMVNIFRLQNSSTVRGVQVSQNGTSWMYVAQTNSGGGGSNSSVIVPPGWYYRCTNSFSDWMELR